MTAFTLPLSYAESGAAQAADFTSPLLNADLHCHSTASDGTQTPEWLAAQARAHGVQLWALTDHDEISGLAAAQAAAAREGVAFLTGVEISVTFLDKTVHIVGLGFDAGHAALQQGLARTRGGRQERAREIAYQLARHGIEGAYEGALQYVGNPDLISRSHFARYLVERGYCTDMGDVFRRYLTEGKPGYVPHCWARLADAVGWVVDAGGCAVLAHPARYGFHHVQEDVLIDQFRQCGGVAIEVITGSHRPDEWLRYAEKAAAWGLHVSRGSDFHCPLESRYALGDLPLLSASQQPVWALLQDRIFWPD